MSHNHKCPKCGRDGESVAAIHYRESVTSTGEISGSGVGPTFSMGDGLGIVAMGMSATQRSSTQSRRSVAFWEPTESKLEYEDTTSNDDAKCFSVVMAVIAVCFITIIIFAPVEEFPGSAKVVSIFAVLVIAGGVISAIFDSTTSPEKDKKNSMIREDYEAGRDMFRKMQYCDNCFLVYDGDGNSQPADKDGYDKMINLNSPYHKDVMTDGSK